LNDCTRIEKLIWDYVSLDPEERAAIELHVAQCRRCREAFETVRMLRLSAENDRRMLDESVNPAFDNIVFSRIRRPVKTIISSESFEKYYNLRLAFSFTAAAVVVLFIVRSISNLGLIESGGMNVPRAPESESKRVINIQLGRSQEQVPPQAAATLPSAKSVQQDNFSILTGPVTAPSPESVNIDAVFVAADNVPAARQTGAASLSKVYADTGAAQTTGPQVSVLITVENMPRPIHVAIPEYPIWAKKRELSANVWVKAKVNVDGSVGDAIVLSCDNVGVGFEESAISAAKRSQFLPASANGMNFAVWVIYPVRFIFRD